MLSVRVICSTQENALTPDQQGRWQQALNEVYLEHIPTPVQPTLLWLSIPKGQAFLAAKPDATTTLLVPVPNGTHNQVRTQFLYGVLHAWCELTGCQPNEVVISAADAQLAEQFMQASQQRFAPGKRFLTQSKLILRALLVKLKTGHLQTSINL